MTSAEEAPLNFEREPEIAEPQKPLWREYTFVIGRSLFSIQSMAHAAMDAVSALGGKVRSVADRGPDDYAPSGYTQGFHDGRKAVPPNMGGVNGSSKILTALVALNTALLIGVGGWLFATVARHDRELAVIACQMSAECAEAVTRGRR